MINTFLIAGIIVECLILALLALFGKLSGKAFAVIALITAICCGVVGVLDTGTHKAQAQKDIRSSIYKQIAARAFLQSQRRIYSSGTHAAGGRYQ